MKIKKILSAVLSAAMSVSLLSTNVFSEENSDMIPLLNTSGVSITAEVGENLSLLDTNVVFRYEDVIEDNVLIDITSEVIEQNVIATYADNSAPVAGLAVMVANPDSLIDGGVTTETILYWLWNDGETLYTYDPDGDEIANYYVSGINDYILGTVSLGDEAVGFATQFTEAGPHDFIYYVEDSYGNTSNIVQCSVTAEPADGSARPICSLRVTSSPYYVNENVAFSWATSYDDDNNDYISDYRMKVYFNGSYVNVDRNSKYFVSDDVNNMNVTLKFDEIGTYTVAMSVSDNHNNWSNWVGGSIEVQKAPESKILQLAGDEWSDSKYVRWRPTGSNSYMYHTLYSRLGGNICVDTSGKINLASYSNHKATYYNVVMAPIAEGTYFMSAETWSSATGNPNDYTDPYFGRETPRAITQSEIDTLKRAGKGYYIVYNPNTLEVIDFYCPLNPLIAYGWSVISYVTK